MGLLDSMFGRSQPEIDYCDPFVLRQVFDIYSDEWPDNHHTYKCWKPDTLLKHPKWAIKQAVKLVYAEWPKEIDWTIFSAFYQEYIDLALHVPAKDYELIKRLRDCGIHCGGIKRKHDPLTGYVPLHSLAALHQINYAADIKRVRDEIRRSTVWDPVEFSEKEITEVRRILLESWIAFAAFSFEWDLYIMSIGRDTYKRDPS